MEESIHLLHILEEYPSGQRGQTVNLLQVASVVRIHSPPPYFSEYAEANDIDKDLRLL